MIKTVLGKNIKYYINFFVSIFFGLATTQCGKLTAVESGGVLPGRAPFYITGDNDLGFGSNWKLSWNEWEITPGGRTFIESAKLNFLSQSISAFGFEIGEPPESLPCSYTAPGKTRVITVVKSASDESFIPIYGDIYKIFFLIPEGSVGQTVTARLCLAKTSIDGPFESQSDVVTISR